MTEKDKPAFLQAFNRLSVTLREKDVDAATMRVYFEALKDLDVELVVMAADELTKRGAWFPKVSEWREAVGAVDRKRLELQQAAIRQRLKAGLPPLCAGCEDTGWARLEDDRVKPCDCRRLRRLEILGRRPMPELTEGAA